MAENMRAIHKSALYTEEYSSVRLTVENKWTGVSVQF